MRKVGRVTGELSAEPGREPTEGKFAEGLSWIVDQVGAKGTIPDAVT